MLKEKKEQIAILVSTLGDEYTVFDDPKNSCVFVVNEKTQERMMQLEISEKVPTKIIRVLDLKFAEMGNELAKKEKAILIVDGRQIANYETLLSVREATKPEKVIKKTKPTFSDVETEQKEKSEEGISTEMLETIKKRFSEEIPKMVSGINDHFGKDLEPAIKKQLYHIVYSTATTSSMATLKIIMELFKELKDGRSEKTT